jgi:hypothetical protein
MFYCFFRDFLLCIGVFSTRQCKAAGMDAASATDAQKEVGMMAAPQSMPSAPVSGSLRYQSPEGVDDAR